MTALKRIILLIAIIMLMASALTFTGLYFLGDIILNAALDNLAETDSISQTAPNSSFAQSEDNSKISEDSADTQQNAVNTIDNNLKENEVIPEAKDGDSEAEEKSNPKPAAETGSKGKSQNVYVPADKVEQIKRKVTLNDKLLTSKMVLSKLTGDEISYLFGLLSGGLTKAELEEAKAFALKKFTNGEISELYALYTKYFK